jgi:hypothetical protein
LCRWPPHPKTALCMGVVDYARPAMTQRDEPPLGWFVTPIYSRRVCSHRESSGGERLATARQRPLPRRDMTRRLAPRGRYVGGHARGDECSQYWWDTVRPSRCEQRAPSDSGGSTPPTCARPTTVVSQTRAANALPAALDCATSARRMAILLSYPPRELQIC